MAANLAKWPSNRGLISKIRPSVGCKGNTVPATVVRGYDLRKPGGHLGNVGLNGRIGLFGRAIRRARSTTRGPETEIAWKVAFGCFSVSGGKLNGECRLRLWHGICVLGKQF